MLTNKQLKWMIDEHEFASRILCLANNQTADKLRLLIEWVDTRDLITKKLDFHGLLLNESAFKILNGELIEDFEILLSLYVNYELQPDGKCDWLANFSTLIELISAKKDVNPEIIKQLSHFIFSNIEKEMEKDWTENESVLIWKLIELFKDLVSKSQPQNIVEISEYYVAFYPNRK